MGRRAHGPRTARTNWTLLSTGLTRFCESVTEPVVTGTVQASSGVLRWVVEVQYIPRNGPTGGAAPKTGSIAGSKRAKSAMLKSSLTLGSRQSSRCANSS
jgi:hypothetical protein